MLRERALQPVPSLVEKPTGEPEPSQRQRKPRPGLVLPGQGPLQCGAEVVVIARQRRSDHVRAGQVQERQRVPPPGGLAVARPRPAGMPRSGGWCPAAGNACRLRLAQQAPVIWPPAGRSPPASRPHRGGTPPRSCQAEGPGEDRQLAEDTALGRRQQLVAPVDRRLQRLVTRVGGWPPVGQEPEPVDQVRLDLPHRQRARPGRGQLDCQRQAIQRRGRSGQPRHRRDAGTGAAAGR